MNIPIYGFVCSRTCNWEDRGPNEKKKLVSMELNCTNIIIDKRSNLIMTQKYKFR